MAMFFQDEEIHESITQLPQIKIQPSGKGRLPEVPFSYSQDTFSSPINMGGNYTQVSQKSCLPPSMLPILISGRIGRQLALCTISLSE